MTLVTIQSRNLAPGDVIMWNGQQCFVEAVDKSFSASVKVKLHNSWLEKHWPPTQQVLRFCELVKKEAWEKRQERIYLQITQEVLKYMSVKKENEQ